MKRLLILCVFLSVSASAQTRSFYMGFSPWLYEASLNAQDWVYDTIFQYGDIISEHMEEGVPWQESYDNVEFPINFLTEINSRVTRVPSGKKVLLQVSPLNISRDGLAPNRGNTANEPLTAPWNTYEFNSPQVKTAFRNYVFRMKEYFQPDYLQIGVESNLLYRNNPSKWAAYVELHQYIYTELKTYYPDLPVSVSLFCVPFFPQWSAPDNLQDQLNALADLETHADLIAFSMHPFMSGLLAESFPSDYCSTLFSYTNKPIAISESSYPAQVWQTITPPVLTFNGSQEKQDAFLLDILTNANTYNLQYVIWYSVRDYDTLWKNTLGESELALIWRDTGLYDEPGEARDAMDTWKAWYAKNVLVTNTQKQYNFEEDEILLHVVDSKGSICSNTESLAPGLYFFTYQKGERIEVRKRFVLP